MMGSSDHQDIPLNIPPDTGVVIVTRLLDAAGKQSPASQEAQGNQDIELTRALAVEYGSVIDQNDRREIEERILL